MKLGRAFVGLPAKEGLRNLFLFDWYEREKGKLPGGSGRTRRLVEKRRGVVYRWWKRLPAGRRLWLANEAASQVRNFNEERRRASEEMLRQLAELQAEYQRIKATMEPA